MREVIVTQSGHHWCHEMRWVMATVSGRRHGSCEAMMGAKKDRPGGRSGLRPNPHVRAQGNGAWR